MLKNRVPPPVVAVLVVAGMWMLAHWWPLWRFELPARVLVGLVVASIGGGISSLGAREFRRAKTTVNPLHPERASSVVTSGIYRYTRNPMYLGILFVLLGFFLAFGALSGLAGLPIFIAYMNRFQIKPEEQALQAKFGREYEEYQARVRRWV